jgi:hypothetical protein
MIAVLAGITILTADPQYIGKWELNAGKSDFGDMTVAYEQDANGEMKVTAMGQSFTLKIDGKDYMTPWGTTTAWKTVNATRWETVLKSNSKVIAKLSNDGKTLVVESKNVTASGQSFTDIITYQRMFGDQGILGKWKTKNVKLSSPSLVEIQPNGSDGVTIVFVDQNHTCAAKFDGKDYASTGAMNPSGWSCAIARNSELAFDYIFKKDAKMMTKYTITASKDSRTLSVTGGAANSNEKAKFIYERQ